MTSVVDFSKKKHHETGPLFVMKGGQYLRWITGKLMEESVCL